MLAVVQTEFRYGGRNISVAEIESVRQLIAAHPGLAGGGFRPSSAKPGTGSNPMANSATWWRMGGIGRGAPACNQRMDLNSIGFSSRECKIACTIWSSAGYLGIE